MSEMTNDDFDGPLKCRGVSKSFFQGQREVRVFSDIDLDVKTGERIAIVGASGAGKSTLLHILGGLDQPTQGEVWLAGENLTQIKEERQGELRNLHLGFVYQFHHLLMEFSALENVAMPLLIRRNDWSDALDQAKWVLEQVGLGDRISHRPGELSGGERQRVAIARALVTRPRCLLADEPTGNLDRNTASSVYELIVKLSREMGLAMVMVTHDPGLAKRTDRILRLSEAGLIAD